MVVSGERTGRRPATWVALLALAVGLGLIAMHAGIACAGHETGAHTHQTAAQAPGTAASGDRIDRALSSCLECMAHAGTPLTMVCAVLLLVAASQLGRLLRRLLRTLKPLGAVVLATSWPCGLRSTHCFGRPPDLQLLEVMRC